MANWCNNTVQFIGVASELKQVQNFFEAMAVKEEKEGCGQLPDFVKEKRGYFFSICVEDDVLRYDTKWSPNSDILVAIAEHFNIEFIHSYEECGMQIFGEVSYQNGIITTAELDTDDFDLYDFDEEKDDWVFEGEHYESDYEIKEILLERKSQLI